jgi:alkyl sulfatase BDS1-like metallo-beta-lactamase superfamily hydrolase
MPMPKGYKSKHGYATNNLFSGGEDYRTIAEKMTTAGYKMNHATARNVFITAMKKLAKPVHQINGLSTSDDILHRTAKDPRFQAGVAEILNSINARKNK